MQALALEIGFSETVFVLPPEEGGTARMRIFNPKEEMPFAGHPVLGTAFVLGAPLQRGVIELETGAGIVPVSLERDERGAIVFGRMSQPVPSVEAADEESACSPRSASTRSSSRSSSTTTARATTSSRSPSEAAISALRPDSGPSQT